MDGVVLTTNWREVRYIGDMAYIRQIGEDEATGALAQIYEAGRGRAGSVANIIKVMSRDAPSVGSMMRYYLDVMKRPNALSGTRREMIATVVSHANDCFY